ncbi:Aste57867_16556 [Aphanomyces stellatus]|uniref:Aste57867_16556 protein n=1 Tax=Aphanomyces stellatus TaxID=120398 RepID=A0A485L635_9STRA|nr:hypothetical protein As57867_016499 [Aphanomyces stellatus]VFT93330.1 Aste57867_16556 [Aphanomyces stellatus]
MVAALDKPKLVARTIDNDGLTYKILQIPDLHYSGKDTTTCYGPPPGIDCKESYMDVMMQKMIDDEKPDFVVFSGDQIETLARLQACLCVSSLVPNQFTMINRRTRRPVTLAKLSTTTRVS